MTPDRQRLEALFLSQLGWIERVVAAISRRNGLARDDADDFASWTTLRLIEDDYGVFRKFRGESALTTYLAVVIAMLFRDYRTHRWGRWRPSAAARRRGPLTVRLETLVYRDGLRLSQAAEVLRTAGHTDLSDRELATLLNQLPVRQSGRPQEVTPSGGADIPATEHADDLVVSDEVAMARKAIEEQLKRLPLEEQLMLRMRYWEGMTVVEVARGLGLPQKPLYRRLDRALGDLRHYLEESGMSQDGVRAALTEWTH